MKRINIASICANTQRVSRTRTLVSMISAKAGEDLHADVGHFALGDFSEDLRKAPYRMALEGAAKTALETVEASDALFIGASATRLGSFPSILIHMLELSDPDRLRGKPAIFVIVGSAGVAPQLVRLQVRLLARIIGLKLIALIYATKAQLRRYLDDQVIDRQTREAIVSLEREFALDEATDLRDGKLSTRRGDESARRRRRKPPAGCVRVFP